MNYTILFKHFFYFFTFRVGIFWESCDLPLCWTTKTNQSKSLSDHVPWSHQLPHEDYYYQLPLPDCETKVQEHTVYISGSGWLASSLSLAVTLWKLIWSNMSHAIKDECKERERRTGEERKGEKKRTVKERSGWQKGEERGEQKNDKELLSQNKKGRKLWKPKGGEHGCGLKSKQKNEKV